MDVAKTEIAGDGSKDTTATASGEEEPRKKKRKSVTTAAAASAAKNTRKLGEERALSFGLVHRTLLAPVTHLSPANGGRPYDPAVFAKFAKPAQDKVRRDFECWRVRSLWEV